MATILFGNGYIGVQIFFMISGFIMVHTTSSIKTHYLNGSFRFLLNRIVRIAPLYYISTFILIADDLNDGYLITHSAELIRSLLFIPSLNTTHGPDYGMPVLEVGWTLNYEMIFYLLFAVSIMAGKKRYLLLFSLFTLVAFFIPVLSKEGFTFNYQVWHDYSLPWLNIFTNPIWLHFVLGVVTGLTFPKIKISKSVARYLLAGSSLLFLFYYTGMAGLQVNALNDLLFCGLLFTGFLLNDFCNEGIRIPKFLVVLGDMSYTLYLFHPLTLAYFQFFCKKLDMQTFTESAASFLPALIITLIVCYFIYLFVEKPLNRKLKSFVSRY
jgi:peptidoglycan/LPS O-acetylase OafA/YrhL